MADHMLSIPSSFVFPELRDGKWVLIIGGCGHALGVDVFSASSDEVCATAPEGGEFCEFEGLCEFDCPVKEVYADNAEGDAE
jgi:hypothetical protein